MVYFCKTGTWQKQSLVYVAVGSGQLSFLYHCLRSPYIYLCKINATSVLPTPLPLLKNVYRNLHMSPNYPPPNENDSLPATPPTPTRSRWITGESERVERRGRRSRKSFQSQRHRCKSLLLPTVVARAIIDRQTKAPVDDHHVSIRDEEEGNSDVQSWRSASAASVRQVPLRCTGHLQTDIRYVDGYESRHRDSPGQSDRSTLHYRTMS